MDSIRPASSISGTLTFADTTYVLNSVPDYGIAGTGKTGTATLTAAGNVLTGTGTFGVGGTSVTPSYDGTLISGVAAAGDVRKTVPRYSGGPDGTLTGCVDKNGNNQGPSGILDADSDYESSGTLDAEGAYNSSGIIDVDGTFHAFGIFDAWAGFYAYGTLNSVGDYSATGVIYGSGTYATEASRNVDPGEAYVLTGHDYTILGAAKTASYNATNLSVGNVIQDVAFGVGLTGTGANLLATHTTYLAIEATRNDDNLTVAGEILTGKSVKIRNSTYSGSLTFAGTTYVLDSAPDYGIGGTGGAKTATLPATSVVLTAAWGAQRPTALVAQDQRHRRR